VLSLVCINLERLHIKRAFLRYLKLAVIIPSASLLLASPAFCQLNGTPNNLPGPITGTVQIATNNAELHNIKVTLTTGSGMPVDSVFSDSRGNFSFMAVPAGNYIVSIDVEGFEPFRESVQVMGRPGPRVYAMLKIAKENKAVIPGNAVSTRELALPQKAQEALHKGLDTLYKKADPAGSLIFFGQVLQLAPDFYEAYYDQGVAYLKLNKQTEAEAALRKAIDLSKDTFADPYITLASMFADKDRFAEAEPLAREALGIQPDSWRGHYELARALFGKGLPVDAEQSAMECRRLQPNFPRLYILLANIQLRLGRNESVIQDLDTYLKLEPDGPYSAQAKQLKEKTEKSLGRAPAPLPLGG
jgi:tetratricopeptide (TPR) repeat protein